MLDLLGSPSSRSECADEVEDAVERSGRRWRGAGVAAALLVASTPSPIGGARIVGARMGHGHS